MECERHNRLHPTDEQCIPYLAQALEGVAGPFIAASDYMKAVGDQVSRWIPGRFVPLGTDGSGMSERAKRYAAISRWMPSASRWAQHRCAAPRQEDRRPDAGEGDCRTRNRSRESRRDDLGQADEATSGASVIKCCWDRLNVL